MVQPPDRRLCSVLNTNLAEDRLDVNLHRSFGDIDLACDALVGIALDQTLENGDFSRRKLLCEPTIRVRRGMAIIEAWRDTFRVTLFGIKNGRQEVGRKYRSAHHDELDGLDERIAVHHVDEIAGDAGGETAAAHRHDDHVRRLCLCGIPSALIEAT